MTSYRDLLRQVKGEIDEVDAPHARELIDSDSPAVVDVRERDEWDEGHLPGAIHVPRGHLESRIEQAVPDRSKPVLLYCAAGNRSAFAAQTLKELGYEQVSSLAGGYTDWKRNGYPTELTRSLSPQGRHALQPPPAHPRGGGGGAARSSSTRAPC